MNENERTIETYNKIAQGYSDTHFYHFWVDEFNYFKEIVPGKKVVDIGCGAGRDAVVFVDNDFDYTGIDASEGMLKVASDRVRGGKFTKMDFYDLTFPENDFDGFWAASSILHIPKNKVEGVLRHLKEILKPGGVGFKSIKEKNEMDEGMIEEGKYGGISRYFAFYTTAELNKLLEEVGFKLLKTYTKIEEDERKTKWLCSFIRKPL